MDFDSFSHGLDIKSNFRILLVNKYSTFLNGTILRKIFGIQRVEYRNKISFHPIYKIVHQEIVNEYV